MVCKRMVSVLAGLGLAGLLAAGCIGARADGSGALSLFAHAATTAEAAAEAARVVRVVDGDTYVMLSGSRTYRLRLLGVDAPEHNQAFGPQATDSVGTVLRVGRVVWVRRAGMDLYGRVLGAVLLPAGTTVAPGRPVPLDSLLVVRGWAWAFDPERATARLLPLQARAQEWGRGLWKCGESQAVPPKVWRGFNAQNKRQYRGSCTW